MACRTRKWSWPDRFLRAVELEAPPGSTASWLTGYRTRPPLRAPSPQPPGLDAQQIREVTARPGDIARRIYAVDAVDADKKGPVYEALGITIAAQGVSRNSTSRRTKP